MKARFCGGEPKEIEAPLDTMLSAKVTLVTGITIGCAEEHLAANKGEGIRAKSTKKGKWKATMELHKTAAILGWMI